VSEIKRYEIRSGALAEIPHAGQTCVFMVFAEDHDREIAQRDARIAALEAEIEDLKLDHMYERKDE
jgi:hypothetical protein